MSKIVQSRYKVYDAFIQISNNARSAAYSADTDPDNKNFLKSVSISTEELKEDFYYLLEALEELDSLLKKEINL